MAFPDFNITPAALTSNIVFGVDLLTSVSNFDVVGIYDNTTFQQLFVRARPMKAIVRETSKIMDQPVETGAVLSDHHIINPVMIDIPVIIQSEFYSSTYEQLKSAFINATLLTVQTRAGVYSNMIIANMPHQEDPEMYDVITMALQLKEVLFVAPISIAPPNAPADYAPADPANSNTLFRGQQSPSPIALPAAIAAYVQTISAWIRV